MIWIIRSWITFYNIEVFVFWLQNKHFTIVVVQRRKEEEL